MGTVLPVNSENKRRGRDTVAMTGAKGTASARWISGCKSRVEIMEDEKMTPRTAFRMRDNMEDKN